MATTSRRRSSATRADRRRHRDDLVELGRQTAHHAAVRPRPRHRRRGARRAGGDQRRARRPADRACRSNPTYRKVNPADAPILILALTSDTLTPRPDVRRRLDHPAAEAVAGRAASARSTSAAARCRRCGSSSTRTALFKYGIGLEDVRAALAAANANSPKGAIEDGDRRCQIYANDQANAAPPTTGR